MVAFFMNKIPIHLAILCIIFIGGCTQKQKQVSDFEFILGNWESVATNSYEKWELRNSSLFGKGYLVRNDSLLVIDSMIIYTEKNSLKLLMHLSKKDTLNNLYELEYDHNNKSYYFSQINSKYPQVIGYSIIPNTKDVKVFAGEGVKPKDKIFNFLYRKTIKKLP